MDEHLALGCPWLQRFSHAAFAADAVIRYLDPREGFASGQLRTLYAGASGFTLDTSGASVSDSLAREDRRYLGAVLSKIATRGVPAPSSLKVERSALCAAADAGILDFDEDAATGQYEFRITPRLEDLRDLILAALVPELTVPTDEAERLLEHHRAMCTEMERRFLDAMLQCLDDPALGLFVVPQRLIDSMVFPPSRHGERVDFAIQAPSMPGGVPRFKAVIEIDDHRHDEPVRKEDDKHRTKMLQDAGWEVTRISDDEWEVVARDLSDRIKTSLTKSILKARSRLLSFDPEVRNALKGLVWSPIAEAQLLATVGNLVHSGKRSDLTVHDPQGLGLAPVVDAVSETVDRVASLHGLSVPLPTCAGSGAHLALGEITYWGGLSPSAWNPVRGGSGVTLTSRPVHYEYVEPLLPARPRALIQGSHGEEAARATTEHMLRNVFRKVSFREGQYEIIRRSLTMGPVVGLLPTAAGKSLCYQLAALLQPGITVVVDPLRSLMLDQQENLELMGFHRVQAIMSGLGNTYTTDRAQKEAAYKGIELGHFHFIFLAPERLQMPDFRNHVKSFAANVPVCFAVVDEAHCVSEWGHDFRPSYLNVGRVVREYCVHDGAQPSLIALTGTASRNVIIDIMRELEIEDQDAVVEPKSFDRKELSFEVVRVSSADREAVLAGKLRSVLTDFGWRPGQPGAPPSGLIFTYFARGPVGVGKLTKELRDRVGVPLEPYAGRPVGSDFDSDLDWEQVKLETQRRFKRNEIPILVSTHAFGMGIDKPNIRFTIHGMLPRSLEEFYQQAGRAGRDGKDSRCVIVFCDDQQGLADELLDTERTSLEEIAQKAASVSPKNQGDAIRNTWFLTSNFLGREQEKRLLRHVLEESLLPHFPEHIGDSIEHAISFYALPYKLLKEMGRKGKIRKNDRETALEKVLYRLVILSGIDDYMKDYSSRKFHTRLRNKDKREVLGALETYLRRYSTEGEVVRYLDFPEPADFRDSVLRSAYALIDYIYDTVEKRRRRAIGQMLQVTRSASELGAKSFREELLAYLEESEFSAPVSEMAARVDPNDWFRILEAVTGRDGITKLLGACRRQLEEFPSHPGLLLLSGLCRSIGSNPEPAYVDVRSGLIALDREIPYPIRRREILEAYLDEVERLVPSQIRRFERVALEADPTRETARMIYGRGDSDLDTRLLCLRILMTGVVQSFEERRTVSHA